MLGNTCIDKPKFMDLWISGRKSNPNSGFPFGNPDFKNSIGNLEFGVSWFPLESKFWSGFPFRIPDFGQDFLLEFQIFKIRLET